MSRHSKNNTALGFFTYAERQKLSYGTKKLRLGRDSLRNFDACYLCLQSARSPMICPKGHLMCKECIYESILAQKKEIARQTKIVEIHKEELKNEQQKKEDMAKDLLIKQFEKTQDSYLEIKPLKSSIDDKEKEKIANGSEKEIALKIIDTQNSEKEKPSLPCFWIPNLTPENNPEVIKEVEMHPQCFCGEKPHKISIKKLIPIEFSVAKESITSIGKKEIIYKCPCCVKTLTNGTRLIALKPCGHVYCRECTKKFIAKSHKCFLCEKKCKDKEMIELEREGTGFSSVTKNAEAKRAGVAFQ